MARKKKSGGSTLSGSEWLATYSDTVTLLLTFFILLYSFSTVDANKFKQISSALESILQGQAGKSIFDFNLKSGDVPIVGEQPSGDDLPVVSSEKDEMYQKVKKFVEKNNLESTVTVESEARGVVIRLKDSVLFESGKADIIPSSTPILDKLHILVKGFPNNLIIVEGHTDNVPIKTAAFPSNWELSTQRAVNVLKFFVETKKENPKRFQAAGYGEYHPIVNNDSDSHRAINRRVNILIVSNAKESDKK